MKKGIIADEISSDLETSFRIMSEKGYAYAELHNVFSKSIEMLDETEVKEVKRLLQKYHLKVSNISSTIFFLCPLYDSDEVSLFNDAFFAVRGDLLHDPAAFRRFAVKKRKGKRCAAPAVKLHEIPQIDIREIIRMTHET